MPQTFNTPLIINTVDSNATFNEMKEQGLINPGEFYLVAEQAQFLLFTVTIDANWWRSGEGWYMSGKVPVPGIKASDDIIVGLQSEWQRSADRDATTSAWALVNSAYPKDDGIDFYATALPTADIPIKVFVVRKNRSQQGEAFLAR